MALGLIIAVYFSYGLFLSQYQLSILLPELKPDHPVGYFDYKGVTHAHTNLSTGSKMPRQVIKGAQSSKLDFLFFTDLNQFEKSYEIEGYHEKVLVSVAGEYSYLDSRLLFYDREKRHRFDGLGQSQVFFANLSSQNEKTPDLFWMAHPLKKGHTWAGRYPGSLDGIEIINLKTIWQKAWSKNHFSFFWSFLIFPFSSRLALLRLYENPIEEIALWDKLNQRWPTAGFVGNDTTARAVSLFGHQFLFPSYSASFDFSTNHVLLKSELTGVAEHDRTKIFQALKKGQFYLSLDILADPKGFVAEIISPTTATSYPMGSSLPFSKGLNLVIKLPQQPQVPFEIAAFRNGHHVMSSNSPETSMEIHSPGVYRVVVRVIPTFPLPDGKKWVPWIYSNPFYVH